MIEVPSIIVVSLAFWAIAVTILLIIVWREVHEILAGSSRRIDEKEAEIRELKRRLGI